MSASMMSCGGGAYEMERDTTDIGDSVTADHEPGYGLRRTQTWMSKNVDVSARQSLPSLPVLVRDKTFVRGGQDHEAHWTQSPRNISRDVDRKIVTHLRRKLNRRMERRFQLLLDQEAGDGRSEDGRDTGAQTTQRDETPFDLFATYTDLGEKVARNRKRSKPGLRRVSGKGMHGGRVSKQRQHPAPTDPPLATSPLPSPHTPLPDISPARDVHSPSSQDREGPSPRLGACPSPGNTLSPRPDNSTSPLQGGTLSPSQSPRGFSLPALHRDSSVFTLTRPKQEELSPPEVLPISPVATPSVCRPETREGFHGSSLDKTRRVLGGDISVKCFPLSRVLRVYMHSAGTDSEVECTAMMQQVYPQLRQMARERGYTLRVVDRQWGARAITMDTEDDVTLSETLLEQCLGSRGVNFITLLGQKYGEPLVPATIPVDEFETVLAAVTEAHDRHLAALRNWEETLARARDEQRERSDTSGSLMKAAAPDAEQDPTLVTSEDTETGNPSAVPARSRDSTMLRRETTQMRRERSELAAREAEDDHPDPALLTTWYRRDTNVRPAVYRLQRISSHYPEITRNDVTRRSGARSAWNATSRRLRAIMQRFGGLHLADIEMRKYKLSLTEVEAEFALLASLRDATSHCHWFSRELEDLEHGINDPASRDYMDLQPLAAVPEKSLAHALSSLKLIMAGALTESSITRYKVPWTANGLNTTTSRSHHNYVQRLCRDVTTLLRSGLEAAVSSEREAPESEDPLLREVEQHVALVQRRARMFHGRKDLMTAIKRYVRGDSGRPLVVYGKAGCGRTATMARAACDGYRWLKGTPCVTVVRVVGATAESCNGRLLLRSLCAQLCHVFDRQTDSLPQDYKGLFNYLAFLLTLATDDKTLLIFLDSLHQLSDENDARKLAWLPRDLPPHVRLIVSTLPEDQYDCFKALRRALPDCKDNFIEITDMPVPDAAVVLDHWYDQVGRRVTRAQRALLLDAFRHCPQPLFLRVLFNESLRWPSYLEADSIKLGSAVKNLATVMFGRLEQQHGDVLVRRALGYLTAARNGVTENELEDLLSLDDAVMNEVVATSKPAVRRLPQLYWLRLRQELGEYLEEVNADGCTTLQWTYMEFRVAADERYLAQRDKAPSYHKALAEYFLSTWSAQPKPYQGNEQGARRHVLGQPLYWLVDAPPGPPTRVYNLRRLSELPYHLLHSQQAAALKQHCLCNFEFVLAKVTAVTLRALFEDFQMALQAEPGDVDIKMLSDTLHLSMGALIKDPRQLGSQVIGRLHSLVTARTGAPGDPARFPFLQPFFLQAREASVPALVPSVTCLTPPGGVLFDLLSGHSDPITAVTISTDGQRALTTSQDNTMKMWELRTGKVTRTFVGVGSDVIQVRFAGDNRVAVTSEHTLLRLWSLVSGDCIKVVDGYDDPASITTADEGKYVVAFYHGSDVMRVWQLKEGGDVALIQQVALTAESDSARPVHKDHSSIVATNAVGPLVLHAYNCASQATVRNVRNGKVVHTLKWGATGVITAAACSREYFVCAVRSQYMQLHEIYHMELFELSNGKHVRSVKGCTNDSVRELFVNNMGSHCLALSYSQATNSTDIACWNLETMDHKHLAKHGKVSRVGAIVDLRYCLTAAEGESTLRIWNLSSKVTQSAPKEKAREGIEQIIPMVDHPRYVITRGINNGPLSVWNVAKGKCAGAAVRIERGLVDSSDVLLVRNTKVVILGEKGFSSINEDGSPVFQTVLVYDLKAKKYVRKLKDCYITPSPQHEYVILDDDHLMGLDDKRSHLVVWSLQTGHIVYRIKPNFKEVDRRRGEAVPGGGRRDGRTTAHMTPWDRRAETVAARDKRHQREQDASRQHGEALRHERENAIDQYMISRDYSIIVASYYAHHLCVFDVVQQRHIQTLDNPAAMMFLYVSALTPCGGHLVHTNYDELTKTSYVTLWDTRAGSVRRRLRNENDVCCMAISDDGGRVVFGKSSRELRLWEPARPNSVRRIRGYPTLDFGVQSQIHIVSGGSRAVVYAGDISVWDLDTETVLGVFTPDGRIQCVTLAMEGRLVVFGLQDSQEVVTLRLMSSEHRKMERVGKDEFSEASSSSEEDEEEGEG